MIYKRNEQYGLPQTDILKNGKIVSNYNLLTEKELKEEGWELVEEPSPSNEELIRQSNSKCEQLISEGFYLDLGTGLKHFGCSLENQANIDNLYHTAFLVNQSFDLPSGVSLEYNTSTDECIHPLTFEQCVGLWIAKNAHVYKHRKACQDEKLAILNES